MSGKMTKFKDLLVDTPNRYTVNGEVKTIVFSPNTITQEGTKDKAEYFNEMQKNGLYNVNATRVVEGTVEFYDIAIEGSDIFEVFDTQFIINFNETNTKLNPVLRFNGNNYYIRTIEGFIDVDVEIGTLQKTYICFLDSANNKLKLFKNERKLTFDTVAEAQTATWLKEGDIIQYLGYYSKNDGAVHMRKIESTDDGSGIAVGSLWANIIPLFSNDIFLEWFGVSELLEDNALLIAKAFNYGGKITSIYGKNYYFNNIICTQTRNLNLKLYSNLLNLGNISNSLLDYAIEINSNGFDFIINNSNFDFKLALDDVNTIIRRNFLYVYNANTIHIENLKTKSAKLRLESNVCNVLKNEWDIQNKLQSDTNGVCRIGSTTQSIFEKNVVKANIHWTTDGGTIDIIKSANLGVNTKIINNYIENISDTHYSEIDIFDGGEGAIISNNTLKNTGIHMKCEGSEGYIKTTDKWHINNNNFELNKQYSNQYIIGIFSRVGKGIISENIYKVTSNIEITNYLIFVYLEYPSTYNSYIPLGEIIVNDNIVNYSKVISTDKNLFFMTNLFGDNELIKVRNNIITKANRFINGSTFEVKNNILELNGLSLAGTSVFGNRNESGNVVLNDGILQWIQTSRNSLGEYQSSKTIYNSVYGVEESGIVDLNKSNTYIIGTSNIPTNTITGFKNYDMSKEIVIINTTSTNVLLNLDGINLIYLTQRQRISVISYYRSSTAITYSLNSKLSGTTIQRPTLSLYNVGQLYFDTTLGKPLWWDGSVWKDSEGTTV